MDEQYIGLMSGTSMDGIDAVLVRFSPTGAPSLRAQLTQAIPALLRTRLQALSHGEHSGIDNISELDVTLGRLFAVAALRLLRESGVAAHEVHAIGSHGQTVFHRPKGEAPTSVQIGDPNLIAELTGITTVADFRRRDMAAGGQGAPLVPAFHKAVFSSAEEDRAVVNIGGIANITLLPCATAAPLRGFDTGPGNALMDHWIHTHLSKDMDDGGRWAATGHVHAPLLKTLLDDPYFARPPPKSTGREHFNPKWLARALARATGKESAKQAPSGRTAEIIVTDIAPANVQTTLCELTAVSISRALLEHAPATGQVLVCGGGAHNDMLMKRLKELLAPRPVSSTEDYGIPPKWVEGIAFAWLARQTLKGLPGNVPSVTGASREVILGGIYPSGR